MNENAITRKEERPTQSIRGRAVVAPPVDIFENADGFLIVADLPGVAADKISIELDKGELTIHGAWSHAAPEGRTLAAEYRSTDFARSFLVPDSIDADRISATVKDGVLSLLLPRLESFKPRSIQVQAG